MVAWLFYLGKEIKMKRRIILSLLFFLLALATQQTFCDAADDFKEHKNVRLQESSWVKILHQNKPELTPEKI